MNDLEFQLYEALHRMVSVFEYAPNDALQTSMEQGIASIQQNHLQVAIVGEFRRGKSSLINALLGMPILPVDIEPTTATVNRIVYGNKPEAVIHYKNGDAELVSIEDLSKYVTKLTDESASIARNVREAEIRYPTELCRHNIDILDTPGLNDEENMTLVTEQVLQYVDAAIVVIKATMPYSDTECEWVARLIGCENIRHILFAVTCMDLVRPRERQRLTAYLLERITQHTLEKVQNLFSDKPDILQKARRMLESQHILHPVSSLMALESFENGDYDQLEESGLPAFKKQLVTILCAQRQLSSIRHANQMAEKIQTWFSQHAPQNAPMELEAQKQRFLTADDRQKQYFQQRSAQMEQALSQIYPTLPFFPNAAFYDEIMQCFIRCLSSIQEYSNPAIYAALQEAMDEIRREVVPPFQSKLQKECNAAIIRQAIFYLRMREERLFGQDNGVSLLREHFPSSDDLQARMRAALSDTPFVMLPGFSMMFPRTLVGKDLIRTPIAPAVQQYTLQCAQIWTSALRPYVENAMYAMMQAEPLELTKTYTRLTFQWIGALEEKEKQRQNMYQRALQQLEEACGQISCIAAKENVL
ncbi:dynamin family protein [Pseudoflavonifractor phocaeensis]|uniref:dynamin family protein n=1 Tax=Pseudoflavonifractor phocaeensis TaxID=1870988 RepID=UPI00195BDE6F|nr:dynamin family protein [Pseudoflavonifractor phocaeensis]MBM6869266.1 dynamin family protein [Pseudoflavonifractor phocaeensis]